MASILDKAKDQITRQAGGVASSMLSKLTGKDSGNNVETVSFPIGLENQAQATYMVIYVYENKSNKQKFSTTVFNSDVDEESYEIGAVTWIKDQVKNEVLDPLKKWASDKKEKIVSTAKDWLNKQKEELVGSKEKDDKTQAVTLLGYDVKEQVDWVNKWIIPKRKQSQSKALEDQLDPTKHPDAGYRLEKAFQIQMPSSSITYKYENGWESTSTQSLNNVKTLIEGIKNIFGGEDKNKEGKQQLKSVLSVAGNKILDAFVGGAEESKLAQTRQVYNPVLVFNYKMPTPRTFSYSFSLYPRNKDELYILFNMIQQLKFYSLPSVGKSGLRGSGRQPLTFNFPAKFSIKFYTNGYENKWFPKTMSLGLTSIEETLTGEDGDMAFFENYFDTNSGNPPRMVKLTLTFQELGIMSREYANLGY